MTVPPLAHAGHWLAQVAYLLPLVVLVAMLVIGKLRERQGTSGREPARLLRPHEVEYALR